jgi:hypothetical protein
MFETPFKSKMLRLNLILRLFLSLVFSAALLFIAPASAQEQASSASPTPQDPKAAPADPKPAQPANQKDETVGKSKLEKETGTVNDRIFDVLPNYVALGGSKSIKPMSTGQKFRLATASVFDWGAYPFNGVLSAIGQAKNDPASWGQGWGAYAKRYGANFADNSIGTYNTVAIYPSLLHEDPRYFQMGQGPFFHRFEYGISRLFVTRTDSAHARFNYSEILGNATAAAISNIYHAPEDRTAGRNASTLGFLILYDGLSNELKEFWPDIRRKVLHKSNP